MDIRRLRNNDLKVWLPLLDEAEVLVRHIPQREYDEILARCRAVRFNPKTHRREEEIDDAKFRSELARAAVCDWRNLVDGDEPYPCTAENIDYLVQECTEFRLLVMDAPLSLEKMLAAEKETATKN